VTIERSERVSEVRPGWIVLKFGGTSVSSLSVWEKIAAIAEERLRESFHVLIVHSALSKVTDQLESLLAVLSDGERSETNATDGLSVDALLTHLRQRHWQLAMELGVDPQGALGEEWQLFIDFIEQLRSSPSIDDRARARVMATGELLATRLGAAYLHRLGLPVVWTDARNSLRAVHREAARSKAQYLSATCEFAANPAVDARLRSEGRLLITQGFIASDSAGDTVLLGRGGSDTSSAYFAGLLSAQRLEIWTDVPGMFSANPRQLPGARQLRELTYDEAQEIATAGAKILHPRCLLPVRQRAIPLHVLSTHAPGLGHTRITTAPVNDSAQVKAICLKTGVNLVSMESPGMWHQVGFLADAFQIFKQLGLSVDLVSTSETNVTVSLDPQANALDESVLASLQQALAGLCRAELIGPCASVSVVGRNIRGILHQLGEALELFKEQRIYLVSQAANDLNLTFVVDESQGERLVEGLHDLLITRVQDDSVIGQSWSRLFKAEFEPMLTATRPWWRDRQTELQTLMDDGRDAAYVYDLATVIERCQRLRALSAVDQVFYAIKANAHPAILSTVVTQGLGLECVSAEELAHVRECVPELAPDRILFTPNFAARGEYETALAQGVHVTLDNLHPLRHWPELFAGREVLVRLDPGSGRGHHQHVRTGGTQSKFGVPLWEVPELVSLSHMAGCQIIGLHAHSGSGVLDVGNWRQVAAALASVREQFPDVRIIDLGGGLGVPERSGGPELDLTALDAALADVRRDWPSVALWLEPGRYVVAESGVMLAKVTQLKLKGASGYVGIATGMNSLIRPALYGAYHEIVNLSRIDDPDTGIFDVVGPICETGDVIGHDRVLPRATAEGDVLLVATAGAYGASMSSHYNLRAPAQEIALSGRDAAPQAS
jgi:diaminopimelate decarboxylase/aspartate kinase